MIVDVVFPLALPHTLSYQTTEEVSIGSFVRAPIGNRTFLGVVVDIHSSNNQGSTLKSLLSVERGLIPVSPKRIELWRWISEYYLCTLGEVMKAAILSKPSKVSDHSIHKTQNQTDLAEVTLYKGAQGRTELYLHHIQSVLKSGKNALLLSPEIGSGDQLFRRIEELLEHRVYMLHSRLTPMQKQRVIQIVADEKEPVLVIGMRSALLWVDMKQFGLIIVDEEHDFSYKRIDPAPRFHARDLALFIGKFYQIPVVLGTACPSFESEYNTRMRKYKAISINKSANFTPNIQIVDTFRLRKKRQMNGSFAYPLINAIEQNVLQRKQAPFFTQRGAKLQEELHTLFPSLRTARLDESSLQQTIAQFLNNDIDILLGMQTIYKSIDWEHIGLVAVFDADKQLSRSDFRAHERTLQILMTLFGTIHTLLPEHAPAIIVQTDQPDHPFYRHLQQGDSDSFVLEQLHERKEYQYPPFVRLIAIRFKHPHPEGAFDAAQHFKEELINMGIASVTGPFAPRQNQDSKLHTQLLWIHLQRHSDGIVLKRKIYEKATAYKFPKGVVQIDVDPY